MWPFIELTMPMGMLSRKAYVRAGSVTAIMGHRSYTHVVGAGFEFDVIESVDEVARLVRMALLELSDGKDEQVGS